MMMAMFLWMGLTMVASLLICLRAAERPAEPAVRPILEIEPQLDTILAIDDDPEFLNITKLALEQEGYHVHAVTNPTDGIAFYRQNRQSVGLVLLDFFMPTMNGDQVFAHLREVDPRVSVLMVTGAPERIQASARQDTPCDYLAKPFRFEELIDRVNDQVWSPAAA